MRSPRSEVSLYCYRISGCEDRLHFPAIPGELNFILTETVSAFLWDRQVHFFARTARIEHEKADAAVADDNFSRNQRAPAKSQAVA